MGGDDMAAQHEQMKARHEEWMRQLGAMDARMDALVVAMNSAQGQAKVDAMSAAIGELVAQRKQMTGMIVEGMAMMHHGGGGMAHMDHASMGDAKAMDCCAGMKMDGAMSCCGEHGAAKGMSCCGDQAGKDATGGKSGDAGAMSCGPGEACGGAVSTAGAKDCCCQPSSSGG